MFDVLQNELKILDLDISNVRGQGYDNGSNMKGKKIKEYKRNFWISILGPFTQLVVVIVLIKHCVIWLSLVRKQRIFLESYNASTQYLLNPPRDGIF